jgi:hypothetical protein
MIVMAQAIFIVSCPKNTWRTTLAIAKSAVGKATNPSNKDGEWSANAVSVNQTKAHVTMMQ